MEIPLFGDGPGTRKRQINLGGTTTATTHASILQDAKNRRQQRQEEKRRQESATKIQSCWRSTQEARRVREQLRQRFVEDITSLDALRCLVLLGQDGDALLRWSLATLQLGSGKHSFCLLGVLAHHSSDRLFQVSMNPSWAILLYRLSLNLLVYISRESLSVILTPIPEISTHTGDCRSPNAEAHVQVLAILLTLPPPVQQQQHVSRFRQSIFRYLIPRGYYHHLASSISNFVRPSSFYLRIS